MAVTRVRLSVSGLVQGVGFRYAAQDEARALGVSGWVRNLPDGTVEIVAQGEPGAVAKMAAWAGRGPRHASVSRLVTSPEDPVEGLTEFEIRTGR